MREDGILLGRGTVRDGKVDVTLPRYVIPGRHTLTVRYLGTTETKRRSTTTTFTAALLHGRRLTVPASLRRCDGSVVLLVAVFLVNLPFVHQTWTDHQLDAVGQGGRGDRHRHQHGRRERTCVDYRLPRSVDPDRTRFSARVDQPTYEQAEETEALLVRVVPGKPAVNRPAGAVTSNLLHGGGGRRRPRPAARSGWRCTAGGGSARVHRRRRRSTATTWSSSRRAGR